MVLYFTESTEWSIHHLGEFFVDGINFEYSLHMLTRKDLIYFFIFSAWDSIPLCAPPTMISVYDNETRFYREGFILTLYLEDGSIGFGEVSLVYYLSA